MLSTDRKCGYYQPELEVMPAEKRRKHQLSLVREAAEFACRNSPGTRKQFQDGGIDPAAIKDLGDLVALPVIRKRDLPAIQRSAPPFGGLTTAAPTLLGRIFVSPGPIYDPEGREEDFWNLRKPFYAGGFRKGDIVQNTFAYHLTPAGLMCDEALRDLGCVVIPAGTGNTEIQATTMRDLAVTGYIGIGSYLLTILQKAAEMGIEPRRDLRLEIAYVAGEILAPSLRQTLEEEYGLHVRQGYITADLGAVGFECAEKNGLHVPEEVLVEILDASSGQPVAAGEVGEVVVTTCKRSYPLFRFATGDLSATVEGRCACGRTSPRLVGILGRADETTKVRGMFIHPGMISEILERSGRGLQGQAVISRDKQHHDELVIRVESVSPVGEFAGLSARIVEAARDILKLRVTVEQVAPGGLGARPKKIDDRRTWE